MPHQDKIITFGLKYFHVKKINLFFVIAIIMLFGFSFKTIKEQSKPTISKRDSTYDTLLDE